MMIDQTDLTATCAFLATYLSGHPQWLLRDGARRRDFGLVWLSPNECCVWDEQRRSYVHLQEVQDHWVAYDVASDEWLEVVRRGAEFVFTQPSSGFWFERADIEPDEVHISGSHGEHCYATRGMNVNR